ncbi:MAG: EamA family transporter [Rhizobiales bacterium]|nr:EamA family transporter [Hyphomicrobiales bacterium]MBA67726.1 EamA family transporter [Hyphomicrobiales bacterium]
MPLERLAPGLFVLLWSTGWIVAKYAAPHADPLTFLDIRYATAAVVLSLFIAFSGASLPRTAAGWTHAIISGVFLHGIYLGGVWWAISEGLPSSVSGLIAALQPLLTAAIAPFAVGERLRPSQFLGIGLGFAGLAIAIVPGLATLDPEQLRGEILPLCINVVSMVSVVIGTLYQKRFLQQGDLRSIAMLQYVGALLFTLPLTLLVEEMRVDFTLEFVIALAWSVFGLSIVSIALLLYLIRRGQVSRAASLIYLVPPAVAIQSWLYFDEPLTLPMAIGTVVVVTGVWLTSRRTRPPV